MQFYERGSRLCCVKLWISRGTKQVVYLWEGHEDFEGDILINQAKIVARREV